MVHTQKVRYPNVRCRNALAGRGVFDEQSIERVRARLRSSDLVALVDYWCAQRGAKAMPARGDIDPLHLRRHLPRLILADVLEDPLRFRFRVVGTELEQRLGYTITGTEMTADSPVFYAPYAACAREKRAAREFASFDFGTGRQPGTFERLLLPLSEDGQRVSMILGEAIYTNLATHPSHFPGSGSSVPYR